MQNIQHIGNKYNIHTRQIYRQLGTNLFTWLQGASLEAGAVLVSSRHHLILKLESWKWSPALDLHQGWYHRGDLMVILHVN